MSDRAIGAGNVPTPHAIQIGWAAYQKLHRALCLCGHAGWEHTGLNEPGCSHGGVCVCLRFRPVSPRRRRRDKQEHGGADDGQ